MRRCLLAILLFAAFAARLAAAAQLPAVEVYKSPYCGCCEKWVAHMEAAGFTVHVHDTNDVDEYKKRFGVPYGYGSCHTAKVGGYLIEGHVPAEQVKRLLAEHSTARGLIVPGMPAGAPGMAGQGGNPDHYDVLRLDSHGRLEKYAHY